MFFFLVLSSRYNISVSVRCVTYFKSLYKKEYIIYNIFFSLSLLFTKTCKLLHTIIVIKWQLGHYLVMSVVLGNLRPKSLDDSTCFAIKKVLCQWHPSTPHIVRCVYLEMAKNVIEMTYLRSLKSFPISSKI